MFSSYQDIKAAPHSYYNVSNDSGTSLFKHLRWRVIFKICVVWLEKFIWWKICNFVEFLVCGMLYNDIVCSSSLSIQDYLHISFSSVKRVDICNVSLLFKSGSSSHPWRTPNCRYCHIGAWCHENGKTQCYCEEIAYSGNSG